jgi:hypothetical protein
MLNLVLGSHGVLGEKATPNSLPVALEVLPPALEGLDVVGANVLNVVDFKGALGASVDAREELVDGGEVASWEDVSVEERADI